MKNLSNLFIVFYLFFWAKSFSQDTIKESNSLVMVLAGDIMGHDSQIAGAYVDSTGSYDYEPTFRYIKDYFTDADIAIGNLEVSLAGKPFKGYPQFSSPDEVAIAAKEAGIDVLLNANNHALDCRAKGVQRTIDVLDTLEILHTGTFVSKIEREKYYPLIIEKKGIRIALLNYTYGTNGLRVDTPYVVNRIDTAIIRRDLEKARLAEPDFTCVTIHWGIEYERNENSQQRRIADFIFKHGADVIIGSHPHVVQPIKYHKVPVGDITEARPVFYSLGNFVSNQRAQYKDGGVIAELHISKTDSIISLDSIAYLPYWVYREDYSKKSIFYVIPVSKFEIDSNLIQFQDNNMWKFQRFVDDTRSHLKDAKESTYYQRKYSQGIKQEELSID